MSVGTRLLGVVAGVLICLELAGPLMTSLFYEPYETHRKTLIAASSRLRVKELALRQAEVTARKLQERLKLNFEPEVARARLAYQEYLLKLSEACGLSSVMISSAQPERLDELGDVLQFSLQGTGTTAQIGKLINGFYRTEALHRVNHITIFQSLGPDSPTHSLTLDVALLVLDLSTDVRSELTLPPTNDLVDPFASQDIFRKRVQVANAPSDYNLSSGVAMLSDFLNKLPTPPVEPTTLEPEAAPAPTTVNDSSRDLDPKDHVRLVGIIALGVKKYALFSDGTRDLQFTVDEQSDLSDLGINARVLRIEAGDVSLLEENRTVELQLGQLYREACPRIDATQ